MRPVFLVFLDQNVLGIPLATIHRQIGGPWWALQWATWGYSVGFLVAIPAAVGLGRRLRRRPLVLASQAVFLVASLLCAGAQSAGELAVFRALQGAGGGFAATLATLAIGYTAPERRDRAVFLLGVLLFLALVAAPLLAGWATQDASWRVLFVVNVPLMAAAMLGAARYLPESPRAPDGAPTGLKNAK